MTNAGVRYRLESRSMDGRGLRNFSIGILALAVTAASCSKEDPAPTAAEVLAEIEGRELTPAEVAEKQEVAQLLCGIDDEVLVRIWDKMSTSELEFQDWVFGQVCRERAPLYGDATGRFDTSGSTGGGSAATAPSNELPVDDDTTGDKPLVPGQSTSVGESG